MAGAVKTGGRNQSMECAKLVAAFFVVFIHEHLPGRVGELVDYLGQFAVPMFFAITGYFNYRAECSTIVRRMKHIFLLYLAGNFAQALALLVEALVTGQGIIGFIMRILPDQKGLTGWVVLQSEFIAGHLWYLHTLLVVYAVYWAYVKFFQGREVDNRPLYYAGFTMLAIYFAARVVAVVYVDGLTDITRNAYLTGIPMFVLGLFIREYQDQIFRSYRLKNRSLAAVIAVGELLTVQQWLAYGTGTAFGTFVAALALILLLAQNPCITDQPALRHLIGRFGNWSTYLYLFHLPVGVLYGLFLGDAAQQRFGDTAMWIRPVTVLLATLVFSICLDFAVTAAKKRTK